MCTLPGLVETENRGLWLELELELELIQARMTQKPMLWVEVGARAVRERSKKWLAGWSSDVKGVITTGHRENARIKVFLRLDQSKGWIARFF
jgi:hypothetical protein